MRQIGRYRLDHVVGSGAFATVWKARDPELDAVVAIKVLADNWSHDADVRARFLAEARLLRRLESPRVVKVHDVGELPAEHPGDPSRPYFVMDHVDGGTLADRVGRVSPPTAVALTREAALAAQVLHDAGVVHRDLKPGNLLVRDETGDVPAVLVADLGSAKLLAEASGYTVTTGTPAYMAPEQAGQLGGFDGRADVYALAVIGHELLSGRRPEDPDDPTPLADEVGVPPAVDRVLAAGLARDPDQRPADAASFGEALAAALRGEEAPVAPAPGWPTSAVVLTALLLLVLGLAAGWLLR